jgi:hypothetical protein
MNALTERRDQDMEKNPLVSFSSSIRFSSAWLTHKILLGNRGRDGVKTNIVACAG